MPDENANSSGAAFTRASLFWLFFMGNSYDLSRVFRRELNNDAKWWYFDENGETNINYRAKNVTVNQSMYQIETDVLLFIL